MFLIRLNRYMYPDLRFLNLLRRVRGAVNVHSAHREALTSLTGFFKRIAADPPRNPHQTYKGPSASIFPAAPGRVTPVCRRQGELHRWLILVASYRRAGAAEHSGDGAASDSSRKSCAGDALTGVGPRGAIEQGKSCR